MNEITIGDKVYISAKRAAEITGYARDYVGQLCREGHVDAKMVGRSWYVYEPAIRAHRFGPESVEAAVEPQKEAAVASDQGLAAEQAPPEDESAWEKPKYTSEKPELLPELEAPRLEELLPPAEETLTDMQAAWREWFEQQQTQLQTPEIESPEVIDERNEAHEAAQEAYEAPNEEVEEVEQQEAEAETEAEDEVVPIRTIAPTPAQTPAPVPTAAPAAPMSQTRVDIVRNSTPAPVMPVFRPISASSVQAAPEVAHYSPQSLQQEQGRIVSERVISTQRQNISKKGAYKASSARARRSYAPVIAALVSISLICVAVAAIGTGYAARYLKTLPAKNNPAINYLVGTSEFQR